MPLSRVQSGLLLLSGVVILAGAISVLLYAAAPTTPAARGPLLLTALIVILIGGLLSVLFLLRWLFGPYRKLVGEAHRAPVAGRAIKSKDEAQFVLETFQSVVAQLQAQQKELERLSAQASERAESAERFSERIVASVPSGLVAFDGKRLALMINSPGRALLRVEGDALGQPVTEILRNVPHLAGFVDQCLATGRVFRREEIETSSSDGSLRRIGATIAPIALSEERGGRGVLCLLTDITEVTNLREQVALKRNLESLGEMSAGLAHEFKNAIATLYGYAQLLQNLDLDERGHAAADSMLNEVRNLSEMVTAFLDFARPQPLHLEEVSVADLINECVLELKSLFDDHGVELIQGAQASSLPNLPHIQADERMLRQALLNLLRNAAEAIPADVDRRQVRVNCTRQSDSIRQQFIVIEIEDTGEGIPLSDLQRVFIPFFTTKAKGHGVGLALAHRVITEHGGTLTASNYPGGGAVFSLRLPLVPVSD